MRKLWIAVAVLLTSVNALAESTDVSDVSKRLDEIVTSYVNDTQFMGSVLVTQNQKTLLDKGYGQANIAWSIKNTPNVRFLIGSLTKQFTAALVLQAKERGQLSLSAPLSRYLSDIPDAWKDVTILELLNQTSGIPDFTEYDDFASWNLVPHSRQEVEQYFTKPTLDFKPGSQFEYSNSNYELLGQVLEKVAGKSYEAQLEDQIIEPLKLNDTGLETDDRHIVPRLARGYGVDEKKIIATMPMSMTIPWSAGSMYSTTHDLCRWEKALFGGKVVNAKSLKLMTTPGKGQYGFGVFIHDMDGVSVVEHGGTINGFDSHLAYLQGPGICLAALNNIEGSATQFMSRQLLQTVQGKKVTLVGERQEVSIDAAQLQQMAGVYQVSPGFSLTVEPADGHLLVQGTGQPKLPVYYQGKKQGEFSFFAKIDPAVLNFVSDADGHITGLQIHENGHDISAKKQ